MRTFGRVAALSVEGVSKSAIVRLERLPWNTVARWLELAAASARRFNSARTRGYVLRELQVDKLNTFLQSRKRETWVFAGIEVWSRLWTNSLVGSRTFRNTNRFVRNLAQEAYLNTCRLITTDGFKFYAPSICLVFGPGCVLAQVIKKIKRNRVARLGTKLVIGSEYMLEDALHESEDSSKLNTAFIEMLNLTIRRGSAYLNRRSPCHARKKRTLDDHLELLRCHYYFCRPHGSLKFGDIVRAPAMQAGLVNRKLSLRAVFAAQGRLRRTGPSSPHRASSCSLSLRDREPGRITDRWRARNVPRSHSRCRKYPTRLLMIILFALAMTPPEPKVEESGDPGHGQDDGDRRALPLVHSVFRALNARRIRGLGPYRV
ncbi:MAG: hypothetical protein ACI8QS_000215 [Planctomycetota bacterium]|jgi:hypothetical protein